MRLEDALLYLVVDPGAESAGDIGTFCAEAIGGGVDIIEVRRADGLGDWREQIRAVVNVCRREDALVVIGDDVNMAVELEADGVHLGRSELSIGAARVALPPGALVGMSSSTVNEAMLALEVNPDYIKHHAGVLCPAEFSGLKFMGGAPMYAAEIDGPAMAGEIVEQGVLRLCIHADTVGYEAIGDRMTEYSRLLGRSM